MSDDALFPLWDPAVDFPSPEVMPDLDIVTHVAVERARPGGFHYLHESTIARHQNRLWLGWANHPEREVNLREELVRGTWSDDDGLTWQAPEVWAAPGQNGSDGYNHPVIASEFGKLWGFFTRWNDAKPSTEVFVLQYGGRWVSTGAIVPGFIPFSPPRRLAAGNWLMGGEFGWHEAAVAISQGDDFTAWEGVSIARPESFDLRYPEVAIMARKDGLLAIMRPHQTATSPVSLSRDQGRTWAPIRLSNFPMGKSQPFCGRLSTGQQYLLCNNQVDGRALLSIAVTRPGEDVFCRVWKIRHQQFPVCRLFGGHGTGSHIGKPTQWSYPSACEYDGRLFVSYTQGKEDCALSIIPVRALAVRE